MVFFTCGACGDSLKKNQVEKHYKTQCRNCEVLSCVDCQKEFWGDDYQQHVKCFTEDEKYGGKNYKPKANANKGERKQEAWTEQVQEAINNANADPKLKNLLIQIKGYTNIPRKKAKFENFLKNSVRIRDTNLITKAWDLIQAQVSQQTSAPADKSENGMAGHSENGTDSHADKPEESENDTKLSKREKKEERRKKAMKVEKKDKISSDNNEKETDKKKKRKHSESSGEQEDEIQENGQEKDKKKKKKKKRKHNDDDLGDENEENQPSQKKRKLKQDEEVVDEEETVTATKFSWEGAIMSVLESRDEKEISLKKLKKKVLAEFWSTGGDGKIKTEEKAIAKFNKKITKNTKLKIMKDKVKLVH